jgi:SPOR domain
MVDDHTQRPYRSSDSIARSAPAKSAGLPAGTAPGATSGSDPLAELARLIGQSDPFSEYGRDGARTPAAPIAPPPGQPPMLTLPPMPDVQSFNPPSFARQQFGGPPLDTGHDLYEVEGEDPRYAEPHAGAHDDAHAGTHDDDPNHPSNAQIGPEQGDFYEDVPPSRLRKGIMVIASVLALAAMGSAGAYGYRTFFKSTGPRAQPPVIKAESAPSKIVPASNKDAPTKQITDRVDTPGQSEKLVSREEKPVEINDKPAGAVFPPVQTPSSSSSPAPGSGVVSPDAKRVRTIAIRPDQATIADSTPTVAPPRVTTVAPPVRQAAPAAPPPQQPPQRVVSSAPSADDPEAVPPPAQRQPVTRVTPAVAQHQAAAPAPSNAPLSLSPDAPAPARVAPARAATPAVRTATVAPTQIAPAAPAAASGTGGSYAVQVSSHPSEAEAQAAFRSLQGKYPGQLGGKQPLIRKVDLGAKGIYYRAMVGPFATGSEASALCSSLKAAGGQCIIQRN